MLETIRQLQEQLEKLSYSGTVTIIVRACGKGLALECTDLEATERCLEDLKNKTKDMSATKKRWALRFAPLPKRKIYNGTDLVQLVEQAVAEQKTGRTDVSL